MPSPVTVEYPSQDSTARIARSKYCLALNTSVPQNKIPSDARDFVTLGPDNAAARCLDRTHRGTGRTRMPRRGMPIHPTQSCWNRLTDRAVDTLAEIRTIRSSALCTSLAILALGQ